MMGPPPPRWPLLGSETEHKQALTHNTMSTHQVNHAVMVDYLTDLRQCHPQPSCRHTPPQCERSQLVPLQSSQGSTGLENVSSAQPQLLPPPFRSLPTTSHSVHPPPGRSRLDKHNKILPLTLAPHTFWSPVAWCESIKPTSCLRSLPTRSARPMRWTVKMGRHPHRRSSTGPCGKPVQA